MKKYVLNGVDYGTEFVRTVLRLDSKFRKCLKQMLPCEYERRNYLKGAYIEWMSKCPIRRGLSEAARNVFVVAEDRTPLPRFVDGVDPSAVFALKKALFEAIDETVQLFGKNSVNTWFVALHQSSSEWGFVNLISQVVKSEMLDDSTVGIVDPAQWRMRWRGGSI